jgi:hypothetical protein
MTHNLLITKNYSINLAELVFIGKDLTGISLYFKGNVHVHIDIELGPDFIKNIEGDYKPIEEAWIKFKSIKPTMV